jgi:hypothetical protein
MDDNNDGAWFRPHRWGIGVGMPIAWQGWLMMAIQLGLVAWAMIAFRHSETAQLIALLTIIAVPFPLMVAKTRGGWRWRWGERD